MAATDPPAPRLWGVVPPLVTPMDGMGAVDHEALARLCDFLIGAGVHGLYPCGSTGEFPLLSDAERQEVVATVVAATAGRVPVFAHVGAAGTRETVALARHAIAAGADGVGAITPYYFPYGDGELEHHYLALAEAVAPAPVYLYNLPAMAGNRVSPALAERLYRRAPNLVGLKDSSGDVEALRAHRAVRAPGRALSVLSGTDGLNLAALELGCDGMISGNANAAPQPFVDLWRAWERGDAAGAGQAQLRIDAVRRVLGGRVAHFKAVLVARGVLQHGTVRAPQPEAEGRAGLVEALQSAGVPVGT